MIQEIINYTRHLKENMPLIFEQNLEPTKGLHIFIEFDKQGNVINFPGEKGIQWDYYDGKNLSPFLNEIIKYEQFGIRIGTRMDKVFDTAKIKDSKKFQIFSCSPFILSFKKQSYDLINSRLDSYFTNAINTCISEEKEESYSKKINVFKKAARNTLEKINIYHTKSDDNKTASIFEQMKNDEFVLFYSKNFSLEDYSTAHRNYLTKNLFNKNEFNSDSEVSEETYGLSGFYNGLNSKKIFLEHKTASMFKGISGRIKAKDTVLLNEFSLLLRRKVFPQPLPIFIDKQEFSKSENIINIYKEDERLKYSQILKRIFRDDENLILQNYYLLFFNYKYELEDFDYVSKFRYSLKENEKYPKIFNLFELTINKELKPTEKIKHIFHFEAVIVTTIFNGALVRIREDDYSVHYFGEIKPEYVSGGEPIFQMIMKYRKAFYDYIYKSKTQSLNHYIWDEIMWNSIIGDLRLDKLTEKGYHSKEYNIKEKLNIWFSLYNYFNNNQLNRTDMASKIPELVEKIKLVANNGEETLDTVEEFAFAAGQVIYFLLNQSKASERTHALLEPFLQKMQTVQLQNSIAQTINTYKHEISFGKGRFERLSAQVLAFETKENLKDYQRLLLAGYFAPAAIYEKKEENINE